MQKVASSKSIASDPKSKQEAPQAN